jgi:hypothetical protein
MASILAPKNALSAQTIARARELDTENDFITSIFGSKQNAFVVGLMSAASIVGGLIYRKKMMK